jgi:integrase
MGRAKRKGWIAENPCADAEKVSVRRSESFNVLSIEQIRAVARVAKTPQDAALFGTAAFTGLRLGELLALRWRHVNFADRILHVERNYVEGFEDSPKSHRRRSVPLSDQALVALDSLSRREHFTGADDLVFGTAAGEHRDGDQVRDRFYGALDAAGLGHLREQANPIVFHDLRHTFGTQCAAGGIDISRIKQWMGHADLATTQRYLHFVPAHNDAARLTEAFGGAQLGTQNGTEPPTSSRSERTQEHLAAP